MYPPCHRACLTRLSVFELTCGNIHRRGFLNRSTMLTNRSLDIRDREEKKLITRCCRLASGQGITFPNVTEHTLDLQIAAWHGRYSRTKPDLRAIFDWNAAAFPKLKFLKFTTHKDDLTCQQCWDFQLAVVKDRSAKFGVEAELFERKRNGSNTWIWEASKGTASNS
jgi:hypothetical protein